jgi:hypothetical protein
MEVVRGFILIDDQGLNIVEPAEVGETTIQLAKIVNVAGILRATPRIET